MSFSALRESLAGSSNRGLPWKRGQSNPQTSRNIPMMSFQKMGNKKVLIQKRKSATSLKKLECNHQQYCMILLKKIFQFNFRHKYNTQRTYFCFAYPTTFHVMLLSRGIWSNQSKSGHVRNEPHLLQNL